jgi:hypothetical protein
LRTGELRTGEDCGNGPAAAGNVTRPNSIVQLRSLHCVADANSALTRHDGYESASHEGQGKALLSLVPRILHNASKYPIMFTARLRLMMGPPYYPTGWVFHSGQPGAWTCLFRFSVRARLSVGGAGAAPARALGSRPTQSGQWLAVTGPEEIDKKAGQHASSELPIR